jgi:protein-S-isoprenylcysteine O-methyltransferase Ste14
VGALLYGLAAYAAFVGVFGYAMGFVGNWFVPKSIDSGKAGPLVPSLLIDAALLAVFVLQHTIMARPGFKRWFTRVVPKSVERSTFVMAASAALATVLWQWRPAPGVVWEATSPALAWALRGVSLLGYGIVLTSSMLISHADLFGLRQTWLRFVNRPYEPVGFRLVGFYKLVRHPLMLGFLLAFWATPVMTVGHLFFSVMVTGYIALGVWFEERDLIREHGEKYLSYKRRVRGIVPIPKSAA